MRKYLDRSNPNAKRRRLFWCQGCQNPAALASPRRVGSERERIRWDPKDGELCVCRVKPGETLVEARSDADVQIVRLTCV